MHTSRWSYPSILYIFLSLPDYTNISMLVHLKSKHTVAKKCKKLNIISKDIKYIKLFDRQQLVCNAITMWRKMQVSFDL